MKPLVVVAQPRSCSSWVMGQLASTYHVIDRPHGELINPWIRGVENKSQSWDWDKNIVNDFFSKHPDGAFKVLAHAHTMEFYDWLNRLKIDIVTIYREDEISSFASFLACNIKASIHSDPDAYFGITREDPVKYQLLQVIPQISTDDKRRRILEYMYYVFWHKSKLVLNRMNCTKVLTTEGLREAGGVMGVPFDFSDYVEPSHYKDTFIDWEEYEKDIQEVLGIKL